IRDAYGRRTTITVRTDNQPQRITTPDAASTTFLYNGSSVVSAVVNPLGYRTTVAFAPSAATVRSVTGPSGQRTTFQVGKVTDPLGRRTTLQFSGGALSTLIDPQGHRTTYVSAPTGGSGVTRLKRFTDALGRVTTLTHVLLADQ